MNHLDPSRTIVAVSSGLAAARRAIVRISGPSTREILDQLLDGPTPTGQLANSAAAVYSCSVPLGWGARRLPVQLYYWPDHRSFTGEPCAELHFLGALPLVEALVEHLLSLGASAAQRGEFTLRSFLAGKIDLTQAEAVLGVIQADTSSQLAQALEQLGGNLSQPVRSLRDQLLELTAHLEAGLDFVEEDIEFITAAALTTQLRAIEAQLCRISSQLESRSHRSRTARVVLVGLPNSGKSSLFNALLGSSRSIVSPQAGTTRDAVAAHVQLGELQIELVDTAGLEELRESSPRGLAQSVLHQRLRQADAAVLCVDLHSFSLHNIPAGKWLEQQLVKLRSTIPNVLLVGTKADLPHSATGDFDGGCSLSTQQPATIQRLRAKLQAALRTARQDLQSEALHATAIRCRDALGRAGRSISTALALVADGGQEEFVSAELRLAIDDLGAIIGEVHTEEILGQIFSRFCIGK